MTSEERGLLKAIRAEPEDDARRLVYADWLDDHGQDERAELVRVQLAIERDGPSAPLLARERDLLTRRAAEWLGPWADACLRFDRGTAVACWTTLPQFEAGTARLAGAGDPPWVAERWLHLSDARFRESAFAALVRSPGFGRLTRFHYGGYRPPPGPGVDPFGGATVRMAEALASSSRSAGLRRLWLTRAVLESVGARALAESRHLARLRCLSLRSSPVHDGGVEALTRPTALPSLTALGLDSGPGRTDMLGAGLGFPRLEYLNLSGNGIGEARLRELMKAPWLARLKELRLVDNCLRDPGAKAIDGCAALSGLRALHLAGNQFGDEGAVALLASPHLRGLRELSVEGNRKITPAVLERFKQRFGDRPTPQRFYPSPDWSI